MSYDDRMALDSLLQWEPLFWIAVVTIAIVILVRRRRAKKED